MPLHDSDAPIVPAPGAGELGFIHRFVPGSPEGPTLLLLHGTGGDENDLLPLAPRLLPGANVLSPRGRVSENGMPRFFRRLAEGVFDVPDLRARTHELAAFVEGAAQAYGFDARRVWAFGYSNGANVAASLLLLRPETLAGAVLARAMVPFEPEGPLAAAGRRVLLLPGQEDPHSRNPTTERLAALLEGAGAQVDVRWNPAGHGLTMGDVEAAAAWLKRMAR